MSEQIIEKINNIKTFKFDTKTNKILNLNQGEETDVENFLYIQNILDNGKIRYKFEKNFEIKILR